MERWQKSTGREPSLAMARALALLVDRLAGADAAAGSTGAPNERRDAVREALRALVGAARSGALNCHVDETGLYVNGHAILPAELREEPLLYEMARCMVNHDVGTLKVQQGAAPGELLTLGRLLANVPHGPPTPSEDGGAPARAPAEVFRSWSVQVTPVNTPVVTPGAVSHRMGGAIARLHAARSDDDARRAVAELLEQAADVGGRPDAAALESIAAALVQHIRNVGPGEGRLAAEGGLRRLLGERVVMLLATRVPESSDRDLLIAVLARTGEMGGRALVTQLMAADNRRARRSYFDAIVTQDSGVLQLREALDDTRWYVVRNAAALLGEMGMTEADGSLIPLLAHTDDRIRIAVARALTRLKTARGLTALQQRLSDGNSEVRRLAAAAYALSTEVEGAARPNSAALGAALATEVEEDVMLELLAAMGKLASSDAVQRLVRIAIGGPDSRMKGGWYRAAALDALVAARGHAALSTLATLSSDSDDDVAAAARRLLAVVRHADHPPATGPTGR